MQDLKIALLQTDLIWENPSLGLANIQQQFSQNLPDADLFVLPEMFTSGFTMNTASCAETMKGATVDWMQSWSAQTGKYLAGSLIIQEENQYYNRLLVFGPEGLLGQYDKKHLFRMAGEDIHYSPGNKKLILSIKGWNISFWICYDLRFPVWMRNVNLEYDAMVLVANWPDRRSSHWAALLKARAIENQSYLAGVNRIGVDGKNIAYSGKSVILDPLGETLQDANEKQGWIASTLSYASLQDYREKFAAWKDSDSFTLL